MDQTPPQTSPLPERPHSYIATNTPTRKNPLGLFALGLFVGAPAILFWMGCVLVVLMVTSFSLSGDEDEVVCNVAQVPLQGIVTTTGDSISAILGMGQLSTSDDFIASITAAENDENVQAILISIDSPGGTPVAADEMLNALLASEKPTVAVIRELGASAAYWVAAGADHIIASPVSDVGSIGVTMSYLETASSTVIEGARWVNLSSGAYKDAGHPERALRGEEEAFFKSQVESVHEYMVDRIAFARPVFTREEVAALADGRAYIGTEALKLKFVDALGSFDEAYTWIANAIGGTADDVVLCEPYGSGWDALF